MINKINKYLSKRKQKKQLKNKLIKVYELINKNIISQNIYYGKEKSLQYRRQCRETINTLKKHKLIIKNKIKQL